MRRDSITLQQLDDRGQDVRAWCWACGRGAVTDSIVWQKFAAKGWPQDLEAAAARFTCSACGSSADVALYPARRDPAPANAHSLLVEYWFHNMRSVGKARTSDPISERASTAIAQAYARRQQEKAEQRAKKRVPTKRSDLQIVGTRKQ
jgi:hypothetical protein